MTLNFINARSARVAAMLLAAIVAQGGICDIAMADEKAASNTVVEASAPEVQVTAGSWKDVEAVVKANRGKIVVVDIWSTSCLPCMTEFPNLVAMHNEYKGKVVCVSFNVDYVGIKNKSEEYYRPRVEDFLKKQKATFTNILSSKESDKIFETLELSSIPAVYVYDTEGKVAKRFDDSLFEDGEDEAFTYKKDVNPFVKALVENTK